MIRFLIPGVLKRPPVSTGVTPVPRTLPPDLDGSLTSMAKGVNDVALIRGLLQQLVAGYEPSGEVVDWVYLAQEREAMGGE